jgi:hypothetical protein
MATCTKCGTEIEKGEKFCPSCGTPVTAASTKPVAPAKQAAEKPKSVTDGKVTNTKIGISAGLMAATAYFLGIVGGWVPVVLVAGYILVAETNEWLRTAAVKAVAICLFFSIVSTIVGLIPNTITIIGNIAAIFRQTFTIVEVTRLVTAFNSIWSFIERLLLLFLGFSALKHGTVGFGPVDGLIEKHTLGKKQ